MTPRTPETATGGDWLSRRERLELWHHSDGRRDDTLAAILAIEDEARALPDPGLEDAHAALASALLWLDGEYVETPRDQFNRGAWGAAARRGLAAILAARTAGAVGLSGAVPEDPARLPNNALGIALPDPTEAGLTLAEKNRVTSLALDEDTAVTLIEWLERERSGALPDKPPAIDRLYAEIGKTLTDARIDDLIRQAAIPLHGRPVDMLARHVAAMVRADAKQAIDRALTGPTDD
jgi:hypothetical protein